MRRYCFVWGSLSLLLWTACTISPVNTPSGTQPVPQVGNIAIQVESPSPPLTPQPTSNLDTTSTPGSTPEPTHTTETNDPFPQTFFEGEYTTDFSKHTVPYGEISALIPKDSIPAIDEPTFVTVSEAAEWLDPFEPAIAFQIEEDVRAYPLQILMWHEIVNDTVAGVPVAITFCPLCNTAIAFKRTFNGQVLDFGTTGRLRFSNLIMYDRQTETWWQQADGQAVAGEYAGAQLTFLPAPIISWQNFANTYPEGQVLSRETGYNRDYGFNPYAGYDDIRNSPFAYRGPETPDELLPMARVLTVEIGGEAVAYPYEVLKEILAANDKIGDEPVVVLWETGTTSVLDQSFIALGKDIGTANAFSPVVDGETLTFSGDGTRILDEQTGSTWNVLGQATAGPLAGSQLKPIVSINHFWFSWAAFRPDTRVFTAQQID